MSAPNPKSRCTPFAWQDKRLLRRIREQCEEPASALGVYAALTVVASDNESEEFQTTHSWLSSLSGFCEKTVRARLADLERIGAVQVSTPVMRAPGTYRLLPFGTDCRTSGNGCRAFGNGISSALPTSEVIEVRRGAARPKTTADRIATENQVKILRTRLADLELEFSKFRTLEDTKPSPVGKHFVEAVKKLKLLKPGKKSPDAFIPAWVIR